MLVPVRAPVPCPVSCDVRGSLVVKFYICDLYFVLSDSSAAPRRRAATVGPRTRFFAACAGELAVVRWVVIVCVCLGFYVCDLDFGFSTTLCLFI